MNTPVIVPTLGESVAEATVAKWLKKVGDPVSTDEVIVELETDKVTLEVNAPAAGTLAEITIAEGATVEVGALLGVIAEGADAAGMNRSVPLSLATSDAMLALYQNGEPLRLDRQIVEVVILNDPLPGVVAKTQLFFQS